ncbi:MAG TPA: hypothetical protein VKU03_12420 [Roseiarcus sp.]|nr:hypothetical protein [Roseiarcus sp.]
MSDAFSPVLSKAHAAIVADAAGRGLKAFRRGFARDKLGPFHSPRSVGVLARAGLLKWTGKTTVHLTAVGEAHAADRFAP